MSKYKLVNLFDKIFITFSVFLIVYAWINFFVRSLWTTFILSLIFSSALVFLLFYIYNKHSTKKKITAKLKKDIDEKFLAFLLMNKHDQLELLSKTIVCDHYEILNDSIVFEINNKSTQIMIALQSEKLSQLGLINLISKSKKQVETLIIICNTIDSNLNTKILKNLSIKIKGKNELYNEYFLPKKIFPDSSNLDTQNNKLKLKDIMKNFFKSDKAKSYFLCGLVLIFSSIILPYHTYYLVFGSTLLIFAIICKLQKYINKH